MVRLSLLICLFFSLFISNNILSQEVLHENEITSAFPDDTIEVKKLFSDSMATTFVIFIKKRVKPHLHKYHSETIYVLKGSGIMTIGEKEFAVSTGSIFNIPKGEVHSLVVNSEEKMKVISFQAPEFFGKDRVFVE